jgi:hypothetical protein
LRYAKITAGAAGSVCHFSWRLKARVKFCGWLSRLSITVNYLQYFEEMSATMQFPEHDNAKQLK